MTPAHACIRCGECSAVCPAGFFPQRVLAALRRQNTTEALDTDLSACVNCQRCDAVCPSQIPLSRLFIETLTPTATDTLAQERRTAFAHASRERYLAREARLIRDKEELAAEREKKRAANASGNAVAAALARAKAKRTTPDIPSA